MDILWGSRVYSTAKLHRSGNIDWLKSNIQSLKEAEDIERGVLRCTGIDAGIRGVLRLNIQRIVRTRQRQEADVVALIEGDKLALCERRLKELEQRQALRQGHHAHPSS